jgi:MFS family permease
MELIALHSLGVIVGGVVGLIFLRNRYKLLLSWTLLGTAISLVLLVPYSASSFFHWLCLGWGFSLGLGMPACLGFFAENVPIEKRGRFSGLIFMFSFLLAMLVNVSAEFFGLFFIYVFFGLWRLAGAVPLLILHPENKSFTSRKRLAEYKLNIGYDKRLWLYILPWFVFNIINAFEELLLRDFVKATFPDHYVVFQLFSLLFHSTSAFVGGFLSDLVGRKPMIIAGFSVVGIAYALIGILPNAAPSWFFFFISEGFAWGLFYAIFVTVVWGDLAPKGSEELYYFIGSLPLFVAAGFQLLFAGYVSLLSEVSAFSLAAFFLFLAVLPILFAPETLPEKQIRERELKSYLEKARKISEKYV